MSHSSSQSLPPHPHQSSQSTIPIELLRGGLNRFAHPSVTFRSQISLILEMGELRWISRIHQTSRALLCIALLIGVMFCGSRAAAITLGGGPKISPQNDVRRFIGSGPTTGIYKDSNREVELEGDAYELTWWHQRGMWDITQSFSLSYYQMEGSNTNYSTGENSAIDYNRYTLNYTLGYAIDLAIIDIHPQYMIGYGEGTFNRELTGSVVSGESGEVKNNILVRGPQILLHFDLTESFFIGLKYAEYQNVGEVKYANDEGKITQNRVSMFILGYRSQKKYSSTGGMSGGVWF